jgi:hypothetical protein
MDVHDVPLQDPPPLIAKVVKAVTSPKELPEASNPWAVNFWLLPAAIAAAPGLRTTDAGGSAPTWSVAVPVALPSEPVIV